MATKKEEIKTVSVPVLRGRVLGVNVYRGYAELSVLSEISKADIYDQNTNPNGTQRDLSPKHAKDAYEYIRNKTLGFWPELFLSARIKDVIKFEPFNSENPDIGLLTFDIEKIGKSRKIAISRVDGNHRLHYADGNKKGYSKIEKTVSFCLAFSLNINEEIQLFKDINKNQKPMNTSHLDKIEVKLTAEEELKRRQPELYIAQKLSKAEDSPLKGLVYEGGKKPTGVIIPLRGLKTGIQYMLSQSIQIHRLPDTEAQYKVINNYFKAIKQWQTVAWENPKDHIILRGAGLWGICFLGAQVIDRALSNSKFKIEDQLNILRSGKEWDFGKNGSFKGYSGRSGALEISNKISRNIIDETNISTNELFDQIMQS